MTLHLTHRPLTEDLRTRLRAQSKSYSAFKGSWRSTLELLQREIRFLQGLAPHDSWAQVDAVLMMDVDERMIRNDGQVRADARPHSPNVALSIDTKKHGPLIFPGGAFYDWQDNVRAIALGMDALRRVDRYGVSPAGEQYRGWKAIGAGTPMLGGAAVMTYERALEILGLRAANRPTLEDVQMAHRALARIHHTDVGEGSDTAQMQEINLARDFIVKASRPT